MNAEKIIGATAVIAFEPELDPTSSLKDFSSAAYLQRGQILDDEVRKLANQIEGSNKYLAEINNLLAEANSAEYESIDLTETTWQVTQNGPINYGATTWQVAQNGSSKTISLDDGYQIIDPGDGTISITDSGGNSLTYASGGITYGSGVLIPKQAGQTPKTPMSLQDNTSIILDNGTKITFAAAGNMGASMVITRGNQDLTINSIDSVPILSGPSLNGINTDANTPDGDFFVMSGGVHNVILDQNYVPPSQTTQNGNITSTITLDDGYHISTPGDGTVSITDSGGNSLTYAPQGNGVLIPMQAGQAAGSAIAMQGNTSIILNNGTKVTFAYQGAALSISSVVITRGNQDLTVSSFNAPPHTGGPSLNGLTTDASTTDGDILVMNGGVHNLSLDEEDTVNYDTGFRTVTTTALTDQQKYFINNQLKINLDLSGSMTQDKWTTLKAELIKIRDNLTGSNQLQVVLLQSALTKYNQNYDAMSNSENKIYSLLKEIGNKI